MCSDVSLRGEQSRLMQSEPSNPLADNESAPNDTVMKISKTKKKHL